MTEKAWREEGPASRATYLHCDACRVAGLPPPFCRVISVAMKKIPSYFGLKFPECSLYLARVQRGREVVLLSICLHLAWPPRSDSLLGQTPTWLSPSWPFPFPPDQLGQEPWSSVSAGDRVFSREERTRTLSLPNPAATAQPLVATWPAFAHDCTSSGGPT